MVVAAVEIFGNLKGCFGSAAVIQEFITRSAGSGHKRSVESWPANASQYIITE